MCVCARHIGACIGGEHPAHATQGVFKHVSLPLSRQPHSSLPDGFSGYY